MGHWLFVNSFLSAGGVNNLVSNGIFSIFRWGQILMIAAIAPPYRRLIFTL